MAKNKPPAEKILIGRREVISLPLLGLNSIEAKIDTGAYTSSMHTSNIIIRQLDDGTQVADFKLDAKKYPIESALQLSAPVKKFKQVRNSGGISETRVIIRTRIEMAGRVFSIDISLTNRAKMGYPILIGRKALRGKFIVDVDKIRVTTDS